MLVRRNLKISREKRSAGVRRRKKPPNSLWPKATLQSQKPAGDDDEDMDPTQFHENRLKFLVSQKVEGKNPYPHKFFMSMSIVEYIEKYGSLGNGEHAEDVSVSLAGRIMSKRSFSSKLFFYDLHGAGSKVQVMADVSKSGLDESEFPKFHSSVKHGDIDGFIGFQIFAAVEKLDRFMADV
ncbi:hypothetical protein PTKIN_Ptkin09bG0275400 [Pterospermum kingtungense]